MRSVGEFVYVNQDGSVRELSRNEETYLSQEFHPTDSGRPYVKSSYKSVDGWGSMSGFISRTAVPPHIQVEPVNPDYVPAEVDGRAETIADSRRIGDIVTEDPDGTVRYTPNPNVPRKERFERLREIQLERQRQREKLAKYTDHD